MSEKTYSQEDLAELCSLASGVSGGISFEKPFITLPDGVWLCLDESFFRLLTVEERIALTGRRTFHPVKKLKSECIYGNSDGMPLLPFPFTALELWKFNKKTSGFLSLQLDRGERTKKWISQQSTQVQELARILLSKKRPLGGKKAKKPMPVIPKAQAINRYLIQENFEPFVEGLCKAMPSHSHVEIANKKIESLTDALNRNASALEQKAEVPPERFRPDISSSSGKSEESPARESKSEISTSTLPNSSTSHIDDYISQRSIDPNKPWSDELLKEVLAFKHEHGLKKTADRLGVSQSAITKHLKKMKKMSPQTSDKALWCPSPS